MASAVAKGKRKAQDSQSPESRSSKRRADASDLEEMMAMSGGEEDHAREDDHGLGESQSMLVVVKKLKHRDDGWLDEMRAEVGKDHKTLNGLLDAKERDLEDLDSQFHTKIRELLTNVLGPVAPRQQSQHKRSSSNSSDDDDDQAAKARPGYEHAQLLFAKSEDLIKYYNRVEKKMGEARVDLVTEQLETFEKEKGEIAELLHCGQEVARRRVQSVLKRPDDKEVQKKRKGRYTKGELDETADMFDVLKKERLQENQTRGEGEEDLEMDVAEGMGLWEVIHDAKKGVKKLAGHLILGEDE